MESEKIFLFGLLLLRVEVSFMDLPICKIGPGICESREMARRLNCKHFALHFPRDQPK